MNSLKRKSLVAMALTVVMSGAAVAQPQGPGLARYGDTVVLNGCELIRTMSDTRMVGTSINRIASYTFDRSNAIFVVPEGTAEPLKILVPLSDYSTAKAFQNDFMNRRNACASPSSEYASRPQQFFEKSGSSGF